VHAKSAAAVEGGGGKTGLDERPLPLPPDSDMPSDEEEEEEEAECLWWEEVASSSFRHVS
jgi:hypothetical protein